MRIHVRRRGEGKGLSSAVLLGFDLAKHGVVLCMDADLQHEPESVPDVARPVLDKSAEFTVGSRHVGDGGLEVTEAEIAESMREMPKLSLGVMVKMRITIGRRAAEKRAAKTKERRGSDVEGAAAAAAQAAAAAARRTTR